MSLSSFYEARIASLIKLSKPDAFAISPIPAGMWIFDDHELIKEMTHSRYVVGENYFSQFPESTISMRKFLQETYFDGKDSILFLIPDSRNNPVGQIGLKKIARETTQLDFVMRYQSPNYVKMTNNKGVMSAGLKEVLAWVRNTMDASVVSLEVRSTNAHAIRFYQNHGFKIEESLPLMKVSNGDITIHKRVQPSQSNVDYSCLIMKKVL